MIEDIHTITKLIELPLPQWKLKQCIILDWYDTPLEGFCELENPSIYFYFKAIAFGMSNNDNDSFIYKAYVTDSKLLINNFRENIKLVSTPVYPYWNPLLTINNSTSNLDISKELDALIVKFEHKPQFLILSSSMSEFKGIWRILQ